MDKVAAKLNTLFETVYMPVFMSKLASRGVNLATQDDLEGALKIAAYSRLFTHVQQGDSASLLKTAADKFEAIVTGQATAPVNNVLSTLDQVLKA